MTRLEDRFDSLGRIPAPDLWHDAERREHRPILEPGPSPAKRAGAAVVAIAIAVVAIAFGIRAFWTEPLPPLDTPVPIEALSNGRIAYVQVAPDSVASGTLVVTNQQADAEPTVLTRGIDVDATAWSPDGSQIAYVVNVTGAGEIFLIDVGTGEERLLLRTDQAIAHRVSWSPDGRWLVVSMSVSPPGDGDVQLSLYAIGVHGEEAIRLTEGPGDDAEPAWSPDGTKIAFVREIFGDAGSPRDVYVINADGTGLTRLTSGIEAAFPAWSPDGTRIAYATSGSIEMIRSDGSDGATLYSSEPTRSLGGSVTWSPDGQLIGFTQFDSSGAMVLLIDPWKVLALGSSDPDALRQQSSVLFDGACCVSWQPLPAPEQVAAQVTQTIDVGQRFPGAVVVGEGGVWVTARDESAGGDVVRLDPRTGDISARIPVASLPGWEFGGGGMAVGLGSIWTTGSARPADGEGCCGTVVTRIDPATNTVAETIPVGPGSNADVWVDQSGIWVLTFARDLPELWLYRLDPTTHEVVTRIDIPANWSNTVFAAGGWIWVLGNTDNSDGAPPGTLFQIDPATNAINRRLEPAEGQSFFVTPSGDRLWFFHDGLRALDAATGDQVAGPLDLPDQCCSGLLADGAGGVWVVDLMDIWHVDATGSILAEGQGPGKEADGIAGAFDPQMQSIWVVHYERTVSRIQLSVT